MRVACSLIFICIWLLASSVFLDRWHGREQQRLEESTNLLSTTYEASVAMYRLATETFVKQVVQRSDVIEVFASGVEQKGQARDVTRGKLFRLLSPSYASLIQQGIEQLHFITAEGRSFLRFHAPARYDDSLLGERPSIRLASAEHREVYGFEIGHLDLGFRYIFPLYEGEKHLGSVETGVTFHSLRRAMLEIMPDQMYRFILNNDVIKQSLFEDMQVLYMESPVHSEYLSADPTLKLSQDSYFPKEIDAINIQLKNNRDVHDSIKNNQAFSKVVIAGDENWVVSFVPVKSINERGVAYLVSYAREPFVSSLKHDFYLSILLTTLAIGALYFLTMRQLRNHFIIRQEKQHLQAIMDTITDGLYLMDSKGHIVQTNPAFTHILGYHPDEILGKISHNLFHVHEDGSDMPIEECQIVSATSQGVTYIGEESFRHKDGHTLMVELTCTPILMNNQLASSVTAFRDITARKIAQEKLLENDRIKGEFIATASHELRTPLAVIQSCSELLQNRSNFTLEQVKDMESLIYQKALALERIVDDLLDVSRIETGRPLHLELEVVDICSEIHQIVCGFRNDVPDRKFIIDIPEKSVYLNIDRFKIHQVMDNLLNNAVKFSDTDSTIRVLGEDINNCFLVSVADKGKGISPEDQKSIFNKFYRVDSSDTGRSGFGLGLYLIKRIVEAHKGSISVESELGVGTTFTFSIPHKNK